MRVLGINHLEHDAGAAVIEDGAVLADVAEERFTRIKYACGPPLKAIDYCLTVAPPETIDVIVFVQKEPEKWAHDVFLKETLTYPLPGEERFFPVYFSNYLFRDDVEFDVVNHHHAHAASAYYTSGLPFAERAVVVTMDGYGGGWSTAIWSADKGKLLPVYYGNEECSLGWFYGAVTQALGWRHAGGEGKTMGLAPYGNPDAAAGVFDGYYPEFKKGQVVRRHPVNMPTPFLLAGTMFSHLRDSALFRQFLDDYRREDLAAEAQRVLEEQTLRFVLPWLKKLKTGNLLCAGGNFLNVKLNQKIWEAGKLKFHWPFPNAGDSGLALGAAMQAYHDRSDAGGSVRIDNLYFGPEFSDAETEKLLKLRQIEYRKSDDVAADAARALAAGKIVGWFQGRMESGPRSLGNRSILMSPADSANKDIINARVKFREAFRPFCPSLTQEHRDTYLKNAGRDEEFMITSFDVTDQKRDSIPAVVHEDGTLRPQVVRKEVNPLYHRLISRFGELTGEYIVLNTSLNLMGEPIACHPRDALRCFYDNGMDMLCLGNLIVEK